MALQAIGNLRMCTGFLTVIVSVAFSGHINVMVVRIQTSGDICVGRFTPEIFLIRNEHCAAISAGLFAYRAEIHDGGFAKGWKGMVILQN